MATTTKAAAPAKKSKGFGGIKAAWIILVICCVLAYSFYYFVLGNPDNFVGGDRAGHPANLMGTVYKGGIVVGIILTLLLTVIVLGVERFFAIKTASGKMNLAKFTAQVKTAIKAQNFTEAKSLCDKMQGSVANVVLASINMYETVEKDETLKKSQKIAKIQQAHEEATQLEMPTLTMNLPMVATIVSLGTLTALFGTVLGMIGSFQALSAGGGADAMALSAGISEALVNTASGILTSWVATVVYNFFSNKIDKLTFALDEVGYTIAATYDMGKIKIEKKDIWIDMTPMSDVMTLLLCFFMLTSTFLTPEPVKVNTPSSVSEVKVPENDVLNILIDPDGKIFVGTENKNNMLAMMQDVTDKFGITLNSTQIKHFREDAMIGAPLSKFADYLNLEPEKMAEAIQTMGIPTDSIDGGMSEFQEWVKAAREANSDIKIAIKSDATTSYKVIKTVMSELQDMNENRYQLITNLKTSSED